jgi:hypothetical protein
MLVGVQRYALAVLPQRHPVHIVQDTGWAPGLAFTGAENLAPHRDVIPGTIRLVLTELSQLTKVTERLNVIVGLRPVMNYQMLVIDILRITNIEITIRLDLTKTSLLFYRSQQ